MPSISNFKSQIWTPRPRRIEPARRSIIVPRKRGPVDVPSMRPRRRPALSPSKGRVDPIAKVLQFLAPGWNDSIPSGVPFMAMRQNGSFAQAIPEDDVGNGSREGGSGSGRSCCCNVCADCKFGTIADHMTATSSGITMSDCSGTCFNEVPPMGFDPGTSSRTSMFFTGAFAGTGYNTTGFTLAGSPPESTPPIMAADLDICFYSTVLASGESDALELEVCDNTACDPGSDIEGFRVVAAASMPKIIWQLVKNAEPFAQDQTGTGGSTTVDPGKGWWLSGALALCTGDGSGTSFAPPCGPEYDDSAINDWFLNWPILFFLGFIDTSAQTKVDCSLTLTFDNLITSACGWQSYTFPSGSTYDYFAAGHGGSVVVTPHIPAVP